MMKILFDQGTPVPLRQYLSAHSVDTVYEKGWSTLSNGHLLEKADEELYDSLITTDQNLRYQQNLSSRRIAIVVLRTTSWPRILQKIEQVQFEIERVSVGAYIEIDV